MYIVRSCHVGVDAGTSFDDTAGGELIVAGAFLLKRIYLRNEGAAPTSVLIYDGELDDAGRLFLGEYDVPLIADDDLVESGRELVFEDPVRILNGLYMIADTDGECNAVVFKVDAIEN